MDENEREIEVEPIEFILIEILQEGDDELVKYAFEHLKKIGAVAFDTEDGSYEPDCGMAVNEEIFHEVYPNLADIFVEMHQEEVDKTLAKLFADGHIDYDFENDVWLRPGANGGTIEP